jgi:hypothetical protein|eukprot:COSAG06_NODE_5_length_38423_cov_121.612645_43_plen_37_part_00
MLDVLAAALSHGDSTVKIGIIYSDQQEFLLLSLNKI